MHIKRFTHGVCQANSYIVSNEGTNEVVMFDSCGCNDKILKYIKEKNLVLKAIFLTHGHFDHIDGLKMLKRETGADICIFYDEEKFLNNPAYNLSDDLNFLDEAVEKADYLFKDGEVISVGGMEIKVIHTPGHTSGSVCFMIEDCIFTGDTLFRASIGRFDFPTSDGPTEIKSIREKLFVLDNDIRVYPGHGFSTTIGKEREGNPYICG